MRATGRVVAGTLIAAACGFGDVAASPPKAPPQVKIRFTSATGAPSDYGNQSADESGPSSYLRYGSSRSFPESVLDFAWKAGGGGIFVNCPDPLCVYVARGRESAFVCGLELAWPTTTINLEPSTAIWGRVTGADGKPVQYASAGVLIHGARHVHPFVFPAETDGSFRVPAVPASILRSPATELFATAPGWPDLRAPLPADVGPAPLDIRLPAGRRVRAHLVGAEKTDSLTIEFPPAAQSRSLLLARPDELDLRVADGTRRIVFVPQRFAAFAVDLPATPTDVDLGDVSLVPGAPVTGRVHGARGPEIVDATVCVFDDALCVRVGALTQHGRFELPNVGLGEHRLEVRVAQTGAVCIERCATVDHVVAGGPALDVVLPAACVALDFRGEDGKPLGVFRATVTLSSTDGAAAGEPYSVRSAERLPWPTRFEFDAPSRPGRFRVVVRAPGYQPEETTIDVDAKGAANAVVVLRE
jgi:hypothetical protein